MIAFSCAHCAMKFQVKDEFAGRCTRCPTCKHSLSVPPVPVATLAVPPHFDGPLSTLARARLACGVTLPSPPPAANRQAARPVAAVLAGQQANVQRFVLEGEIARGGMGAVLRAVDCDLRREVAVKYLLDQSDPRKQARFVEEAQITGQLEHPNIVPIHELGIDGQGRLFFAMKMVHGRSLQQILEELRDAPRSAAKEWPLGRLLTVFVSVCNALAYAHSRGVVHRDLKPANIMVGDFGEVYVMDWGLAKIVRHAAPAEPTAVIQSTPSFAWAEDADASAGQAATVRTSRQESDDRTMDGAILGTPLYMAPEQAQGQLDAIDARTDVYALGAILYKMLTLLPAIDRQGGAALILARVVKGEIVPPEKRTPQRRIPAELSAVALKALAREPANRYPSAEALRRDVELYQEGRSVSAREDSKWELAHKFVKRHKGFSVGMAATLLVLLCSLGFIGKAWLRADEARRKAEDHYAAYRSEQKDKEARTAKAVPALVQAARLAAQERHFEDALAQLELAHGYDPDYAPIELVRGQVLVGKFQFKEAAGAVQRYLKKRPADTDARELARLLTQARAEDGERLLALADVLMRQKALGSANYLLEAVVKLTRSREKLLPLLPKRIEAYWPGLGNRLSVGNEGSLRLELSNCRQVEDLTPLQGMPLTALYLAGCQVHDLSPLKGMPLTSLNLDGCSLARDLSPLRGMPLTALNVHGCVQVHDLSPLKGMPLTTLHLSFCGQVRDLSPLKGMPLTTLNLHGCSLVGDLSPLKGMPLTTLSLYGCGQVRDLSPLKGMPLTTLNLGGCSLVRDLSPLKGMPLTSFWLPPQVDRGMSVLREIKTLLNIGEVPADEFWKKYDKGEFKQYKP